MGIADLIAAKRNELAHFVTESAQAVLSEQMTDAARGAVALDLLRLMVSSGLSAMTGPMLDVSPAQPRKLAPYDRKPAPTDEQIAEALAATGDDVRRAAKVLDCTHVAIISYLKRAPAAAPVQEAPLPTLTADDVAAEELAPQAEGVDVDAPRRGSKQRFTDEAIATALEAAGGVQAAAAKALGCSDQTIYNFRKRAGFVVVEPKAPSRAQASADGKVRWTEDKIAQLRELAVQSPRPPKENLAAAFGVSVNAIQTALSRYGITKWDAPHGFGKAADLSGFQKRDCMTCSKPFLSEGKHNRMCARCVSSAEMECAA